VYDKSQVRKTTSWIEAHGVALFDSPTSSDFTYQRRHRFWIYIDSDYSKYDTTVQVINLDTYEAGIVSLDQVCWYPKIQGPNNEFWTLGGGYRILRKAGAGKKDYYSWVIRQQIPSTSLPAGVVEDLDAFTPTTKCVEVPTKDVALRDAKILSLDESRDLFKKRLCYMESSAGLNLTVSSSANTHIVLSPPSSLPTPPTSPDHIQLQNLGREQRWKLSETKAGEAQAIILWRRIMNTLPRRHNCGGYASENNLIQPREVALTHESASSVDLSTEYCKECDFKAGTPLPCIAREASPSHKDSRGSQPTMPEVCDLEGATILLEIFRDGKECPGVSVTSPSISHQIDSVYDSWSRKKPRHNPLLDGLCDRNDPECEYSTLFSCQHFHSPPSKCLLGRPSYSSTHRYSSYKASAVTAPANYSTHPHKHCISRLTPLPSGAGDCMLATLPSRNHRCCLWDPTDLPGISMLHRRGNFQDLRTKDKHCRKRAKIHDRRGWIDRRMEMRQSVTMGNWDCEDLSVEGRRFRADLEAGVVGLELDLEGEESEGRGGDELWRELGLSPDF